MENKANEKLAVVFFAGEGVFSHVLDSQVLVPLQQLGIADTDIERSLVILTGCRHKKAGKVDARIEDIKQTVPGAKFNFQYRLWGGVPFQENHWAGKLRKAFRKFGFSKDRKILVHCRGHDTTAAAALLKKEYPNMRILFDIRGVIEDEANEKGLFLRYMRWKVQRTLRRAFRGADGVNTVSKRLAQHYQNKGLMRNDVPTSVIGCCVDVDRFYYQKGMREQRRNELGFGDKFVLCYCGGMSRWQVPHIVADYFAIVAREMPQAHLHILSRQAQVLADHLEARGITSDRYTKSSASHDQVASYLMSSDAGLLLREDRPTNQVAFPVKFAEYLRCGLPVIMTKYVGDLGEFVVNQDCGKAISLPLDEKEVISEVQDLYSKIAEAPEETKQHCSNTAKEFFTWEKQIHKLISLYNEIL